MWNFILIVGFILIASAAYASWRGAPWVPTWKRDLKRIERLAHLKEGDRFVELGCGTARVCRHLARVTSAKTFGVELSVMHWAWASLLSRQSKIYLGDVFHRDLSSYDVVYMFLMPETYQKIRSKLLSELKPGSRVISYVWPIPDWKPVQVDQVEGSSDLYEYVVGGEERK